MPTLDSTPRRLAELRGVQPDTVARLAAEGIRDTATLLARVATPRDERALADKIGVPASELRGAKNRADLSRIDGVGPVTADLFDRVGVNSVRELARRSPLNLFRAADGFARAHPELSLRAPSASKVTEVVTKAALATGGTLVTDRVRSWAKAEAHAQETLKLYATEILFGQHPEGQPFRDAILAHRPQSDWPGVLATMLAQLPTVLAQAERTESPTAFTFSGTWLGLHTEIAVRRAGGVERLLVEID